jgi:hypothetical protein
MSPGALAALSIAFISTGREANQRAARQEIVPSAEPGVTDD